MKRKNDGVLENIATTTETLTITKYYDNRNIKKLMVVESQAKDTTKIKLLLHRTNTI